MFGANGVGQDGVTCDRFRVLAHVEMSMTVRRARGVVTKVSGDESTGGPEQG